MTLDGKILRGISEPEILTPAIITTSQGDVFNLPQLKLILMKGIGYSES